MNATLLTSVVVASLVASFVGGLITTFTVILERRARRKELIFTKDLELAKVKLEFLMEYAKHTRKQTFVTDPAAYAEWYYGLLVKLHEDGKLPPNWGESYPQPTEADLQRSHDAYGIE
jgi:hypothetical protein